MKLLSAEEMRNIDRKATQVYQIPSLLLMENAGLRVVEKLEELAHDLNNKKFVILAGRGNNGGDGLVAARHLINSGAWVEVFLCGDRAELGPDSFLNYSILEKMEAHLLPLVSESDLDRLMLALLSADYVIDALYGIGFQGCMDEFESRIARIVNWSNATVLAVDIPSGVEADTGRVQGEAIKASHTVTFALPKLGLVLEPGREYVGSLTVVDISIPTPLLTGEQLKTNLINKSMVKEFLPMRKAESHKGSYGHVLVIGGSSGMTGAVIMAAAAALRSGAGLVTAAVPQSLLALVESAVVEVMTKALPQTEEALISTAALPAIKKLLENTSLCAIGPGMAQYPEATEIIRFVLEESSIPILIDADALNALQGHSELLKNRSVPLIITPHPGEMARLTGLGVEEIQENRIEIARHYAQEWGIIIVLKGNKTVVAGPNGEVFVNITGNPGMATAGSGDVLAGIISGLLAQGLQPVPASITGVYIHGEAGDRAAAALGQRGLVASDLINNLTGIWCDIEKSF